jgi:glycosyltransferase involved in cell wall biosynthesis
MKTSIILPARNEEQLIKEVLIDIHKHLKKKKYQFEIIVVINGCTDSTQNIIEKLQKTKKEIKIVESKPGYGFALKKGIKVAKGDYIVVFNVDFYDLKLIDLIDIDLYGRDFVLGSKRAHWSEDKRSFSRRLVSFLFNNYLALVHNFKGSDTHGIKVIKKEVLNKIFKKCKTTSGIFDTELVLRAQNEGFKLADFPVVVEEKRPPRFTSRLINTPIDIYDLTKSLKK